MYCTSCTSSSCAPQKASFLVMKAVEKISAVALGIFSAYISPQLFVPTFFVGIGIGIYSHAHEKNSTEHAHEGGGCTQGFLEQLTGVKLPTPVSLAANVGIAICHIEHHTSIFVPIVAVSLGAWVGKMASCYGILKYRQIEQFLQNQAKIWNFDELRDIPI